MIPTTELASPPVEVSHLTAHVSLPAAKLRATPEPGSAGAQHLTTSISVLASALAYPYYSCPYSP